MHFEFMMCCSFMTTIGLNSACTDAAWAVLLAMAQLFNAEQRLKDESGRFLWEAEGISTPMVEGARQNMFPSQQCGTNLSHMSHALE
jgi:hypothetical protein